MEVLTVWEGKTYLNRPLQHLIPLQVNSRDKDELSVVPVQPACSRASSHAERNSTPTYRPRRIAAELGQINRRDAMCK